MVERCVRVAEVGGSNPLTPTTPGTHWGPCALQSWPSEDPHRAYWALLVALPSPWDWTGKEVLGILLNVAGHLT